MSYYELNAEQNEYFYFQKRGNYVTTAHFHGALEFLFVKEGEQEVSIGGERRVLHAGDACFVESFTPHSYLEARGEIYILLGGREYFEEMFIALGKKQPPKFFRFENFHLLEWLFKLCLKSFKNPFNRSAIFESTIKILISEISETTIFEYRKKDNECPLICQILQYVEDHLQDDLSLRTIANKFGYSYEYLSRLLKKYLLVNWKTYINRLRVRLSARLLKTNTTESIIKIAFDCGFDSVHTFYRAYKKEFGETPRENK